MDPDPNIYILILLLLLSGFFSSAEIIFFSLSNTTVHSLVKKNVKNASLVDSIKKNPQRLLLTILIGKHLVNIAAASLATVIGISYFHSAGIGIAIGVMTLLILFFGEIIPKSIAQKRVEQSSLRIAPIVRVLMWILSPIVFVMNGLTNATQRFFRVEAGKLGVSEEEVKAMVVMGHEEGNVEADEREMIEKVFQLNDITAENVMTPEEYIVSFDIDTTVRETLHVIQDTGYSRFPVMGHDGEVEGILYIKDVFSHVAKIHANGKNETLPETILNTTIDKLMQPALFVPESTQADELLKEFQQKRKHIGIVVDEHGNVQGLVTLEDLLEEIVGEIIDESDFDDHMIQRIDDHTIEVDPRVSIGRVNNMFDSRLRGSTHKTIGWLVLKNFGRIPENGDSVLIDDYNFIVEEADDRRIKRLKMIRTAKAKLK